MKKILVFSSYGGGGHISATDALKGYLDDEYTVTSVYYIDEVIGCYSIIKTLTFNRYTEEKFYNYCLRKKWTWFINKLYETCLYLVYYSENPYKRVTTNYIKKHKADLVVSVIPVYNNIIKKSCIECNVPFLLIPTDLDSTSFVKNITSQKFDKFKFAIPFQDADILNFTKNAEIPESSKVITGFPIKSNFFEPKDKSTIKKDFNVPAHKPVILVLMGAAGSKALYSYLLTLLQLKIPVHLLLCLGRNEGLRKSIEKIQRPPHITLSIISYTQRISDLMAISDLCITKAGNVSVCEAIYMNLPMILDNTSTPLVWEKFIIGFIQKNNFGSVITHYKQLNKLVHKMLTDSLYYNACKTNLINFPKKSFGNHIKDIVAELLH